MRGVKGAVVKFGRDSGASMTVEFVLLVPVLIGTLLFGYEFGRALWAYDVVTRDVRAAVRFISRANPYDAAAETKATNVAKTGSPSGTTAHFPWTNAATIDYTEPTTFTSANYSVNGFVVRATATVPITMSIIDILNTLAGTSLSTTYTFTVFDEARWIGN